MFLDDCCFCFSVGLRVCWFCLDFRLLAFLGLPLLVALGLVVSGCLHLGFGAFWLLVFFSGL